MANIDTQRYRKQQKKGLPSYMATFADLMALMMTFFVLLLSFAEIDALKFRRAVESMQVAFGTQRDERARDTPEGELVVAQQFNPGEPQPSPLEPSASPTSTSAQVKKITMDQETAAQAQREQIEDEVAAFRTALDDEIDSGLIEVENQLNRIVIRIEEQGAFSSGDARLNPSFRPILAKVHGVLLDTDGLIAVAGHTDDRPISTPRFASNWELSTARATSVVHALLAMNMLSPQRFVLEGYADTKPLVPNNSADNRARNRRVELLILKTDTESAGERSVEALIQQSAEQ